MLPKPMFAKAGPSGVPASEAVMHFPPEEWFAQVKLDGIRCLALVAKEGVSLTSRNGKSLTHRFPEVVDALRKHDWPSLPMVLDGEVGALLPHGMGMDFNVLQGRPTKNAFDIRVHAELEPMEFVAFDLLREGPQDWMRSTAEARLLRLHEVYPKVVTSSDDAGSLFRRVDAVGGEGVIMKRRSSAYEPGARTGAWTKVKSDPSVDELWVLGLTQGTGSRAHTFGSLVLAREADGGGFEYVGKAGSGLRFDQLERIWSRAREWEVAVPQVGTPPNVHKQVRLWLLPAIKADVRFERAVAVGPRFPRVVNVVFPDGERSE